MTGTQIHEALGAVADAVEAPQVDRLAFQRLVRRERRRTYAGRATAAAAAGAAVVAALLALPGGGDRVVSPATPPGAGLAHSTYVLADGTIGRLDAGGTFTDLRVPAEEIIGATDDAAFFVGTDSQLHRIGQDGDTRTLLDGVRVQSAQVSGNAHWLGWVDLEEQLHVRNLDTGEDREPVQLVGPGYLVDLSDAGVPVVSDDRGLVLLHPDADRVVASGVQWDATIAGDRLAVPDLESTLVYEITDSGGVHALWDLPGAGRLSPAGDAVVSVGDEESGHAWLTVLGQDPVRLDVEGMLREVSWTDDDTALISSYVDQRVAVFACDVGASTTCTRLDVGTPRSLSFVR